MTARTTAAITDVLHGRSARRPFAFLLFAGPAVIASIAYMDPGNFATNIQAGARYGYALLWVLIVANLLAMLFQALSAKLGLVTERNLAELCRDEFSRPAVVAMWMVSEMAAMATDLAEFLGGAIGLSLLFHLPLLVGMVITGLVTYGLLMIDRSGFRPMEMVIGGLVAVIGLCYIIELAVAPIEWGPAMRQAIVPSLPDAGAITVAVGIIGATIMPHAIYLHSGLTQGRVSVADAAARRRLLRFSNREVVIALAFAGLVNMAMVLVAAAAFHRSGHSDIAEIDRAYHVLTPLLGAGAAGVFLVSLLASGISSSVVGTMAGQMIMQGFLRTGLPLWLRRLVTMAPAFVVVALGVDATRALIWSQVVLSLALPVPMIALVRLTRRRDIMGEFANGRMTDIAAIGGTIFVLTLNCTLIGQVLHLPLPSLT